MILYTAWYGIVYSLVQYSMKNGIVCLSCIGKGNSTLRNDNWWPTMPLYSQSEPSSSCWHKHSHSDCSRLYVGWTKGQRTSKRCFTRVPTFGLSEAQSAPAMSYHPPFHVSPSNAWLPVTSPLQRVWYMRPRGHKKNSDENIQAAALALYCPVAASSRNSNSFLGMPPRPITDPTHWKRNAELFTIVEGHTSCRM